MNPGAPGDMHTSVLTAPVFPEAGAPGLCSVPNEAQTSSSHPSQQERNPQVLTSAFCWGCVCVCVCGAHTCARVRACGQHLPSRAVCSGARCARFRSALADNSLMVLGAGQTTLLVLQAEESGFHSERTVCGSCCLAT